jgi:hypothetical protein
VQTRYYANTGHAAQAWKKELGGISLTGMRNPVTRRTRNARVASDDAPEQKKAKDSRGKKPKEPWIPPPEKSKDGADITKADIDKANNAKVSSGVLVCVYTYPW